VTSLVSAAISFNGGTEEVEFCQLQHPQISLNTTLNHLCRVSSIGVGCEKFYLPSTSPKHIILGIWKEHIYTESLCSIPMWWLALQLRSWQQCGLSKRAFQS